MRKTQLQYRMLLLTLCFLLFTLLTFSNPVKWEDQIIYFLMIDRFANGDETNDVLTESGIEAGNVNSKYNGGDIRGMIDRLDYIKDLGVTAVWLTPPVANQWWDGFVDYGGYHGYWARDFKQLDEHFGNLALYEEFIDEAHKRGLYVIQDIVCNHTGNFFLYDEKTGEYSLNDESIPTQKPTQFPFDQNDYNDPEQRDLNIYNWPSEIETPNKKNTAFANLDDLNTENEKVIKALKDSFNFWIEKGVDGFRIDTAIYVDDPFWPEFLEADDGIYSAAEARGKENFIAFGEAWVTPKPMENDAEKLVAGYFDLGFNSMLDFPLMSEIHRVFKEGKPTANMQYRLEQREAFFSGKPMITFIDNHDMSRFLNGARVLDLQQALAFIFTIPGVPTIYYGTEQGLDETRAAMFKGGFMSEGEDRYDKKSFLYDYIHELTELRKEHEAFRHGTVKVEYADTLGPGPLIYSIKHGEEEYLVFMNTYGKGKYASDFQTGLAEGRILKPVYTSRMISRAMTVGENGTMNVLLDPKSVGVFKVTDKREPLKDNGIEVSIEKPVKTAYTENFTVSGSSQNTGKIRVFVDGNKEKYREVKPDEEGNWRAEINLADFISGTHKIFAKAYGKLPIHYAYSDTVEARMEIPIQKLAEKNDPLDDDHGPTGDYEYPRGEGGYTKQMDIDRVALSQIGQMLKMEIRMNDITDRWAPRNGFDHVTFQIFFDDPDQTGIKALPKQQAEMPKGDWDYQIYATGWSLTAYTSTGAGPDDYGKAAVPAPTVKTEQLDNKITLLIPLSTFDTTSIDGWKVYFTTYDYDGIEALLRPISDDPGKWAFKGPSKDAPKIMDDLYLEIE